MTDHVAIAETDIQASPAQVWAALTDPEQIRKFMFGAEVHTDWQQGSPITWAGVYEGKDYEDHGTILEVERGKRLVMTHYSPLTGQPDVPESYHTLTYRIEQHGPSTHLTLSQDNNATDEEAEHSRDMWESMLEGVKKSVEDAPEPMNPVEKLWQLLHSEHLEVERLLDAVTSQAGGDRAAAFGRLRRYLAVHEAAEGVGIHTFTAPPEADDRLAEEDLATRAIADLEGMDPGSDAFDEAFGHLAKDVRAHAAAEEHEEMPAVLKDTSSEQVSRAYAALAMVPELVAEADGRIPDGAFAQMHAAAVAELGKLAGSELPPG